MTHVELLCLAYSRKHQGKCIAGLRTDGSGWVRPVSKQPDGTLTAARCQLADGSPPQPLDVLRVGLMGPRPLAHQPENWVLDQSPIQLVARPASLQTLTLMRGRLESGPAIFGTTASWIEHETFANQAASQSLTLVRPTELRFYSKENQCGFRQLRAKFVLQSAEYDLPVTDPRWENRPELLSLSFYEEVSWRPLAEPESIPLITISLSEPYTETGRCYKLAACIFAVPSAQSTKRQQ